jgi:hypothetical protein
VLESVRLVAQGGKTYLFYNASGLGDVYEIGDEPRITSIAPLSGIPAGGTSVSIYGSGFAAGTTVTFDGVTASTTFVSASELTAVTPTHASGAADVVANVPAAASMTAPRQFTYELTPPQQFVATATSTTSIDMMWNSVNGATAYEVSRRAPDGMWSVIGTPAGTSFTDGGRAAETTYVYRVRATDAGANFSAQSAVDLATTFSNESVTIAAGMLIRLADMSHVYARVNAVRTTAGLAPVTFNGTVGGPVLASHVNAVRTALRDARTSLGLTTPPFTDASITPAVLIKAVHLNQVLALVE